MKYCKILLPLGAVAMVALVGCGQEPPSQMENTGDVSGTADETVEALNEESGAAADIDTGSDSDEASTTNTSSSTSSTTSSSSSGDDSDSETMASPPQKEPRDLRNMERREGNDLPRLDAKNEKAPQKGDTKTTSGQTQTKQLNKQQSKAMEPTEKVQSNDLKSVQPERPNTKERENPGLH